MKDQKPPFYRNRKYNTLIGVKRIFVLVMIGNFLLISCGQVLEKIDPDNNNNIGNTNGSSNNNNNSGSNNTGETNGGNSGGVPSSFVSQIKIKNTTFRKITIKVGSMTEDIEIGEWKTILGNLGMTTIASANTWVGYPLTYFFNSDGSSDGSFIDNQIFWTSLQYTFPNALPIPEYELKVPSNYFYLMIENKSDYNIEKGYVDGKRIPSILRGQKFEGYFPAYSNSKVRLEASNGSYWELNDLKLPFTENQSVSLAAR